MRFSIEPVGHVRVDAAADVVKTQWDTLVSRIEILPEFEDALTAIDGFSHLIVLSFLDRVSDEDRAVLMVRPRGLLRMGLSLEELPEIGVFACDSPVRPNPIGVSVVEVIGRQGRFLRVRGLDLFDGTPIVDMKPFTPDRSVATIRVPEWQSELTRKTNAKRV